MIFLDAETVSLDGTNLKTAGSHKYAKHVELECICWQKDGGPVVGHLGSGRPPWMDTPQTIVAHNAQFERLILESVYGVTHHKYICTMAMARAANRPASLENAAIALGLADVKDMTGRALFAKIAKARAKGEDTDELLQQLLEYCKQDVRVLYKVYLALPKLSYFEQKVYETDQAINDRGIPVDVGFCRAAHAIQHDLVSKADARIEEITKGAVTAVTQVPKMREWVKSKGVPADNLDRYSVQKFIDLTDDPDVKEVLELRKMYGRTSTSKYKSALDRELNGRIKGTLSYHSAHTGRWAAHGFQAHNLVKPVISYDDAVAFIESKPTQWHDAYEYLFGTPSELLSSCVRAIIKAPTDKCLLISDYSQVEPRALAWCCGLTSVLDDFREGKDPYIKLAAEIFGKPEADVTPWERSIGKFALLGLGYGMGAVRFVEQCATYGIILDLELAQRARAAYLVAFPQVRRFWYALQGAFVDVLGPKKDAVELNHLVVDCKDGSTVTVKLPSGRKLYYHGCKTEEGEYPTPELSYMCLKRNGDTFRKRIWGGYLVENVIQAICRDLQAHALYVCEQKAPFDVVMHVHDEIVAVGYEHDAAELRDIMTKAPWWCEELPIAAESKALQRFWK